MKKIITILGFITAIIAVILSVTPLANLAIFPIIIGVLCVIALYILHKKMSEKPKSLQYIGLLTAVAIAFTIYNGIFKTTEVGDVEQLEQREEKSVEDAKNELEDLDIDMDI